MAEEILRRASLTQQLVSRLDLVEHASIGSKDHIVWDEEMPSFGVRLRPSRNTYVVQYRVGGQQRRESLGDVRKIALKDARKAAGQRFAKVELGIDPSAQKSAQRDADRTKFGPIVDRYLAVKKTDLRPNTWNAVRRYLKIYWRPLHGLPIATIPSKTVASLLTGHVEKHGRTAAARGRSALSAFFAWAIREQYAVSNPTISTHDPGEGLPARDRVLDDREIRAIWAQCRDDDFGRIVKLLLITSCRRDEIGGLSWPEIDFAGAKLTLPSGRTKSKRALVLPLPHLALEILRECPPKDEREFLFGQRGGAFSRWSWEKLALDKRIIEAGDRLLPWRLHDLRRTAATRMGELKVRPHVIEAVLNHSYGSDVSRTYNRYDYFEEKAEALSKWAERLVEIASSGQIIKLSERAAGEGRSR